jgi:hypothetical protein
MIPIYLLVLWRKRNVMLRRPYNSPPVKTYSEERLMKVSRIRTRKIANTPRIDKKYCFKSVGHD